MGIGWSGTFKPDPSEIQASTSEGSRGEPCEKRRRTVPIGSRRITLFPGSRRAQLTLPMSGRRKGSPAIQNGGPSTLSQRKGSRQLSRISGGRRVVSLLDGRVGSARVRPRDMVRRIGRKTEAPPYFTV